jgi:phosphohistidine phosphatase SixA
VIVYLVRHATAGHRASWEGDDDLLRPLDDRGRRQAEGLVELLGRREFERIVSSPAVRCVDTVVPLADSRGLTVEPSDALAEGAGREAALELFRAAAGPLVASVHGDTVEELTGGSAKKGSTTVLEVDEDRVEVLERLPRQA